ncbi:MAG: hypothetical protein ABIL62_03090, partial [Planctomycetota bacterium]
MAKIKPNDLDKIGETIKRTMLLREGAGRAKVIVHMGTSFFQPEVSISPSYFSGQIEQFRFH